jgi:hypothetical protein
MILQECGHKPAISANTIDIQAPSSQTDAIPVPSRPMSLSETDQLAYGTVPVRCIPESVFINVSPPAPDEMDKARAHWLTLLALFRRCCVLGHYFYTPQVVYYHHVSLSYLGAW